MDWDLACEEIANNFSLHEKQFNRFLCKYQATLSDEILKRVRQAIRACSDGRFCFYWHSGMEEPIGNDDAIKNADELFEAINEANEMLRKEVHEMISVPST